MVVVSRSVDKGRKKKRFRGKRSTSEGAIYFHALGMLSHGPDEASETSLDTDTDLHCRSFRLNNHVRFSESSLNVFPVLCRYFRVKMDNYEVPLVKCFVTATLFHMDYGTYCRYHRTRNSILTVAPHSKFSC